MFIEQDKRPAGELTFSEVMNKAADLIERRGHTKMQFYDECGGLCSYAAIVEAASGKKAQYPFSWTPHHGKLEAWLDKKSNLSICAYNNVHSKNEVIAMLRRAATEA